MKKFINLIWVLKIYGLALLIFFCFRLILFIYEINRIDFNETNYMTVFQAFMNGVRFDIVISSYILILPYFIITILFIINRFPKIVIQIIFWYIVLLFIIAFIVCGVDIPYFHQFFSRFSMQAFQWMDSPKMVFGMILQEPIYFLFVIPFLILTGLFIYILKKIFKSFNQSTYQIPPKLIWRIATILFLGIMIYGVRGRIEHKSPIKIGTAYFCDNPFLNQLGLNPNFTLLYSYIESTKSSGKEVNIMDNKLAVSNTQNHFNRHSKYQEYPLYSEIIPDTLSSNKPNIVIVLMESMATAKMKRYGNQYDETPFFDSLTYHGLYFENLYSTGYHTYNGVYSTLTSYPALFDIHPMKIISKYNGISHNMKKNGYSTTFFTSHDSQFDNMEGFLRENEFDYIYSEKDYPPEEIKTVLGVPDDYLLNYTLPILDNYAKSKKPFFVTILTSSDHGPFYIPPYFTPKNTEGERSIVEYADWSLRQFIKNASKKEWFKNTIFVFVADHGDPRKAVYDISMDYHHIPLLFYAPYLIKNNQTFSQIGSQMDVYPTLMGLINAPYVNNSFGVNLFKEKRDYTIISSDDKIGIIDNDYFLIMRQDGSQLYKYRNDDRTNYYNSEKKKAAEMENYLKSQVQAADYLIRNNKTYKP